MSPVRAHRSERLRGYTSHVVAKFDGTSRKVIEVQCTCSCGKARVVIAGPFLGRVRCHCTICQSANRAAFADSTILLAKHVPLDRVEHVQFRRLKKPPALQRGFCRSCGCFVVAYMTYLPFLSMAFVPAARYPSDVQLPEPAMHVYYEYRVADVDDDLPKYSGWPSLLAVFRLILKEKMVKYRRA